MLARNYAENIRAVAQHLEWPEAKVQAAFNYAAAFPEEINEALAENDGMDFTSLKRMLPQLEEFVVRKTKKR